MKKIALFALAALCVTAAQAVTVNWTVTIPAAGQPKPGNNPTGEWITAALVSGGITAETFADYGRNTHDALPTFPQWGDSAQIASGSTFGNTTTTTRLAGQWHKGTQDGVYAFSFGDVTLEAGKEYSILFGNSQGTVTNPIQWVSFTIEADAAVATDSQYDIVTSGTWSFSNDVATNQANTATTVPEPTALALLALGVAGLALKRKHA